MKTKFILAFALLLLSSCAGTDSIRLESDRANLKLAARCAAGWFQGLPFSAEDQRQVSLALADWQAAITADEKLVGGGGK